MSRRKWLWCAVVGIPLVAAGALAASTFGSRSTSQVPAAESVDTETTCSRPDCCSDCPPDCPPEACPLCEK
jgi:hypothetical protein